VQINDLEDYHNPYYARTVEISREQYEKLNAFGQDPTKQGFSMHYSWHNNCVDFTWHALHYAGISANTSTVSAQAKKAHGHNGNRRPITSR
jgi:hypothetical protein